MDDSTYFLGVTGGMGAGKTEVCHLLEKHGAEVFYADLEARRIMEENLELRRAVQSVFGENAYLPDGRLNRPHISQLAFKSPEKLKALNEWVHPLVHLEFEEKKRQASLKKLPMYVREAAILVESGGQYQVDAVLVVDAHPEIRMERLLSKGIWTREEVEARLRNQAQREDYIKAADFIIENNSDKETLEENVSHLWNSIMRIHRGFAR